MERLATLTKSYEQLANETNGLRWLKCLALAQGNSELARDDFKRRYQPSLKVLALVEPGALATKAAVLPGTTTTPSWAGALVPDPWAIALVTAVREATIFARMNAMVVPSHAKVSLDTTDASEAFSWVDEGAPKPMSQGSLAAQTLPIGKLAGTNVFSVELARASDGAADSFFRRRLIGGATIFVDRQALDPTNAGSISIPKSLTNGVTPTAPGATASATATAVLGALFTSRPQAERPVLIASPATFSAIAGSGTHPALAVNGGTVLGVPAIPTIGAGTKIVAVDAAAVGVADGGSEFEITTSATLQMNTTPDNPATPTTVFVSLWQMNLIGVRVERWISWANAAGAVAFAATAT